MDYRGIITKGYHVDAGGQNTVSVVSQGYIGILAIIQSIIINVERYIFSLLPQRWSFVYDINRLIYKI